LHTYHPDNVFIANIARMTHTPSN